MDVLEHNNIKGSLPSSVWYTGPPQKSSVNVSVYSLAFSQQLLWPWQRIKPPVGLDSHSTRRAALSGDTGRTTNRVCVCVCACMYVSFRAHLLNVLSQNDVRIYTPKPSFHNGDIQM